MYVTGGVKRHTLLSTALSEGADRELGDVTGQKEGGEAQDRIDWIAVLPRGRNVSFLPSYQLISCMTWKTRTQSPARNLASEVCGMGGHCFERGDYIDYP